MTSFLTLRWPPFVMTVQDLLLLEVIPLVGLMEEVTMEGLMEVTMEVLMEVIQDHLKFLATHLKESSQSLKNVSAMIVSRILEEAMFWSLPKLLRQRMM
ncbi:hypothetical protein CJ030_MR2G019441 [Morella rubra]|uniref:Uncharacterized protein n=1 Tax=Morella rubra TaxID=262757 RepID=A0A6A1WCA5_9ROSI|nr:hypothetical protein CJ030_MR2G019441 [Morella rubra]